MKKKVIIVIILIFYGIVCISGCEEKKDNGQTSNGLISGNTNLIEVVNHNMRKNTTYYSYDVWEVYGTIKNIAGRKLTSIRIMVDFYDSNGNLLNSETDSLLALENNYTEEFCVIYPDYYKHYDDVDNYKIKVFAE